MRLRLRSANARLRSANEHHPRSAIEHTLRSLSEVEGGTLERKDLDSLMNEMNVELVA